MSEEFSQDFRCLLFYAGLTGREFRPDDIKLETRIGDLKKFVTETGLLDTVKIGGATGCRANAKTHAWVAANLHKRLDGKKIAVLLVYQLIQNKTAAYLKVREIPLAEFLAPQRPPTVSNPVETVRNAYFALTTGSFDQRVLLKDLRKRLPMDRESQDSAFLELIRSGEASFYPEDDPMSRNDEDEQAALVLADRKRHVVYLHRAEMELAS
jgi:hypothetical protein